MSKLEQPLPVPTANFSLSRNKSAFNPFPKLKLTTYLISPQLYRGKTLELQII